MAQYTIDTVVNRLDDIYTMLDIIAEKVEEVSFDDVVSEIRDLKNVVISRPAAAAAAGTGTSGSGNGGNNGTGTTVPNNFYSDVIDYLKTISKSTVDFSEKLKTSKLGDEDEKAEEDKKKTKERQIFDDFFGRTSDEELTRRKTTKGAAKVAAAQEIVKVVSKGIEDITELVLIGYQKREAALAAVQKIVGLKMDLYGNMLNKSTNTVLSGIFKKEMISTMYEAYQNMLDISKENLHANLEIALETQRYEKIRYEKTQQQWLKGAQIAIGAAGIAASVATGGAAAVIIGAAVALGELGKAIYKSISSVSIARKQLDIKYQEMLQSYQEKTIDQANRQLEIITNTAKQVSESMQKIDSASKQLGLSMGYSGEQLQGFTNKFVKDATNTIISQFGKGAEDMIANQASYREASDRNIALTVEEQAKMFASSRITGLDDKTIATMVGGMHEFNISAERGNDLIYDIYKNANKLGVNATKAVQEFSKNLKLASKVNFKDGINGLKEMVTWSMKTRFNMESIGGMVDKMMSGGLEGVMESAAKLSVIGGNAAIYGDPLGLLYGTIDAQDLAERLKNSISDLGTYDRATGETKFSRFDRERMRVIAEAYGVSPEELDIMARTQKQRGDVERALGGSRSKFTEEQRDLINAHAKFNQETGKWEASIVDKFGGTTTKDIAQLNVEDLKNLTTGEYDKDMVKFAAENLDETTRQTAVLMGIQSNLISLTTGKYYEVSDRARTSYEEFAEHQKELATALKNQMDQSANALDTNMKNAVEALQPDGLYWAMSELTEENIKNLSKLERELTESVKELIYAYKTGDYTKPSARATGENSDFTQAMRKKRNEKIKEENDKKDREIHDEYIDSLYSSKKSDGTKKGFIEKIGNIYTAVANSGGFTAKDASVTYPQTLITSPNSTVTKVNDGAVSFHKDDQIIAAKPGGGIYEMIRNTYDNISKMVQSPPPLQAPRNDVYRAEITVKLESKDGKVDITSIVRDTDGMRMITDRVLQTIAQKKTAFWINSNEI